MEEYDLFFDGFKRKILFANVIHILRWAFEKVKWNCACLGSLRRCWSRQTEWMLRKRKTNWIYWWHFLVTIWDEMKYTFLLPSILTPWRNWLTKKCEKLGFTLKLFNKHPPFPPEWCATSSRDTSEIHNSQTISYSYHINKEKWLRIQLWKVINEKDNIPLKSKWRGALDFLSVDVLFNNTKYSEK